MTAPLIAGATHPFPVECPESEQFPLFDGMAYRFQFTNGLGISAVRHQHSIGAALGRWEIAVLCQCGDLIYSSSETDAVLPSGVVGNLTEAEVAAMIASIARLPSVSCSKHAWGGQ